MPQSLPTPARPQNAAIALPRDAHMVLATTWPSLERLAPHWQELEKSTRVAPHVFQSWNWVHSYATAYADGHCALRPFVVVGYNKGRVVYLLPLQRITHYGLRILSWLTHPVGQYGDALCDKNEDIGAWTSAALKYIAQTGEADCLRLRHVRESGALGTYAARQLYDSRLDERAPAMDLAQFADEQAYDARYTKEQRHRRKRILKKLQEQGEVKIECLSPGAEQENEIDLILAEKLKWLNARGRFNQVLRRDQQSEFLKSLARLKDAPLRQVMTRMSVGGKPLAWDIGFQYGGTHSHYLTAHVHGTTDLSPGRLMLDYSIKRAITQRLSEFDLLPPFHPHKESFSSRLEKVNDYYWPFTARGAVFGHGYLGFARPMVRKAYHALPPSLLKPIMRLTGN